MEYYPLDLFLQPGLLRGNSPALHTMFMLAKMIKSAY